VACCPKFSEIKFCSINVCGLKSKLLLPDFDDLIKCHDICIFLESKIDDLDILNLPNGYKSFSKCRQKFCKKSGGITIVFKTEYERYLNFPKTDSEYIQWIKFSKDIFSDEFLLGCVYIPPENSKYSTIDAFTEIENEFISLLGNNS
jgi:exonuclease III